jgi:hypothetical protein
MAQTVGEFILEKLCNMAAWIERETGQNGLAARMQSLTPLQASTDLATTVGLPWLQEAKLPQAPQDESELAKVPVAPPRISNAAHVRRAKCGS